MTHPLQVAYDRPTYSVSQAAQYVDLPVATLRSWVGPVGLIQTPEPNNLSFNNLAEAHILKAMRRNHRMSMQGIRKALSSLSELRKTEHPLLDEKFMTDGISLCIEEEDKIVNLNRELQTEIREFAEIYLARIERENGRAARLYPFISKVTSLEAADEPKHISISPTISFGRPVLVGTGIATSVIAGRFSARDTLDDLAKEFGVEKSTLEDAIRWEMLKGKAA